MDAGFRKYVEKHARTLITSGLDRYGAVETPMFMATLDPATGEYPRNDVRPQHFKPRAYRYIFAPRGSSAYWDQPTLRALYALAELTRDPAYRIASDAYLDDFMRRSVSKCGLFLWGNHYFYDAFDDQNVYFGSRLRPVAGSPEEEVASLHEMRPIVPAWAELARVNRPAVLRQLREAGVRHIFDSSTVGFNRHADQRAGCAFLEAGAVLVHALAFHFVESGEEASLERALRIASYSFEHRDRATGLLVNNPTETRWDGHCTTTEVGFWARLMFQAARLLEKAGGERPPEVARLLDRMGREALVAYARHGYDERRGAYYGRLALDGSPILGNRETEYQPGDYSDVWEWLFPTHDYPMSMAMAALDAAASPGAPPGERDECALAARRWAEIARDAALREVDRSGESEVRYAENYGRLVVYLARYGRRTGEEAFLEASRALAQAAVRRLWRERLFVGNTRADWYDAIDGVGYLLLALLYLETGNESLLESF